MARGGLRGGSRSYLPTSKYKNGLEYRLARIERNVRNSSPELKQFQKYGTASCLSLNYNQIEITGDIAQGVDEYNRSGNQIKIHGIKITGAKDSATLATWVTLSPNGVTPSAAVFTNVGMPQVLIAESEDHKIIKYLHNFGSTAQEFTYSRKFKTPLTVNYRALAGPTETDNKLTIGMWNFGVSNHSIEYNITVYFTDA